VLIVRDAEADPDSVIFEAIKSICGYVLKPCQGPISFRARPLVHVQLVLFGTIGRAAALALARVLAFATVLARLAAALAFAGVLSLAGMLLLVRVQSGRELTGARRNCRVGAA